MKALLLLLLRAGSSEPQQEEATELRGVGVNVVDLFWGRLRGANSNSSSSPLARLRTRNISLIRFAASPYCPNDFALWGLSDERGGNRSYFLHVLDSIILEAKSLSLRLIPSLLWRPELVSMHCREPMSALLQKNESCSRRVSQTFIESIVGRYAMERTIVAWELGNEMNMLVDQKFKRRQRRRRLIGAPWRRLQKWKEPWWRQKKKKKEVPQHTGNSNGCPSASKELCACSRSFGPKDRFSTQAMVSLDRIRASWVREHDPLHRPISSGHAIPRSQVGPLATCALARGPPSSTSVPRVLIGLASRTLGG